ncbi:flagellar assembly protein FliH [Neobacillus sp. PS3-40]|uniref:flagellar assembly protein FliH n=1 Tax=Neobacillus sp. PS3-40 TaxID=3070679 RepID=UPI0027E136DB|nr:flagellar assembly protein FliH [Neobacillus sp. PS3-40]WML43700.1 flagellar assembly protein FliH [Neobacillus sp. PS3-40]
MSRLIKSQWANPTSENQKVISIKMLHLNTENESAPIDHYDSKKEEMLTKAKQEAELLVQNALLQAQSIREQIALEREAWDHEKKEIAEEAKRDGYAKGLIEGKDQGYQEYQDSLSFAKEVVTTSRKDYQQQIVSAEKTILRLGMKVAEQIIGLKLVESETTFLSIVKRALKEAREYKEVQLHMNPVHYGFVLSQKEELLAIFPREVDIYIYPDEDLSKETCIIESSSGRIDASIDSQLEEIKRKLLELLESENE